MLSSLSWKEEDTTATAIPPSKPLHTFIPAGPPGLKILLIPSFFDDARRGSLQHCIHRHAFLSSPTSCASVPKKERRCDFDLKRACIGSYGKKQPVVLFPPPLPMLARTKDQKSYRWRYYGDGHMVIKEFELDRHDFFQVMNGGNGHLSPRKVYADGQSPADGRSPARQKADEEKASVVVHLERLLEEPPSPPSQSSESGIISSASSDSTSLPSDIEGGEGCTDEEAGCMDSGRVLLELPRPFRREMVQEDDETGAVVLAPPISTPPSPEPAFPELCEEAYAIENSILFEGRLLA